MRRDSSQVPRRAIPRRRCGADMASGSRRPERLRGFRERGDFPVLVDRPLEGLADAVASRREFPLVPERRVQVQVPDFLALEPAGPCGFLRGAAVDCGVNRSGFAEPRYTRLPSGSMWPRSARTDREGSVPISSVLSRTAASHASSPTWVVPPGSPQPPSGRFWRRYRHFPSSWRARIIRNAARDSSSVAADFPRSASGGSTLPLLGAGQQRQPGCTRPRTPPRRTAHQGQCPRHLPCPRTTRTRPAMRAGACA